jgi:hypothetical protein
MNIPESLRPEKMNYLSLYALTLTIISFEIQIKIVLSSFKVHQISIINIDSL